MGIARRTSFVEPLEPRRLMATYYVSPLGDDAAAGTSELAAWRTIGRVNAVDFNPGDAVLFEGGATFSGTVRFGPEDAGTAAAPVFVGSYGAGGRATIHGGDTDAIRADNAAGFEIADLRLVGSGVRNTALDTSPAGINFSTNLPGNVKLQYLRVHDVEATGFWEAGIFVEH